MSFVLDTSVTMAWLFEDESTKQSETLLDRLSDEAALVPYLWMYEVANVLVIAERRQRITEAQARRFTSLLRNLPIEIAEDSTYELWDGAMNLARIYGLSAYDSAYLDLAMKQGLPLATQDKALKKAASQAGVEVY